jgi:hypothetical protein
METHYWDIAGGTPFVGYNSPRNFPPSPSAVKGFFVLTKVLR